MKKLNHTNLVSLIEVLDDPEEDSLYMVMEMCKKGVVMKMDLEDDVEPYREEECRTWFRDLILGIEYRTTNESSVPLARISLTVIQCMRKALFIETSSLTIACSPKTILSRS